MNTPEQNNAILEEVKKITKEENPCGFKFKGGEVTCNSYRGKPCCTGCSHLSKSGCTVKAAACRFWFCEDAFKRLSQLAKQRLAILLWDYDGDFLWRHDDASYPNDKLDPAFRRLLEHHPKVNLNANLSKAR